jgi:tetratricopeptide (TPR) repeat protein
MNVDFKESTMSFTGFCPVCNSHIPNERYSTGHAICACGWTDPSPVIAARKTGEKEVITVMVGVAIAVALGFAHLASWGSYALTIPVVKIQQLTGTLSAQGYQELANACIRLNKWSCASEAFIEMQAVTKNPEGLAMLGDLQIRLHETQAALTTYAGYFRVGGRDGEAALKYAKLLENHGDTEAAIKYYESSIELRPKILPIQATTGIVRILMRQGRFEDAQKRILAFHESAENAKGYLNTELAQVEAVLESQKPQPKGPAGKKPSAKHVAAR